MNFTSGGAGTTSQFAGELLRMQLGANLVHVSYKAAGQGLSDVIAGTLPAMIWQIPPLKAHIAAGSLKAIAAMSARRIAGFPNVPTISETLIPGFDSNAWFGLLAPGGTPKAVVERLHAATLRAMESAEMKQTFETQALEPSGVGLEKFRELIRADLAKWKPVVEAVKPAR